MSLTFATAHDLTTDFANWLTPMIAQLLAFEGPLGQVTSLDVRAKVTALSRPLQLASVQADAAGASSVPLSLDVFGPAGPATWRLDAPLPSVPSGKVLVLTGGSCLDEDAWLAQGKLLAFEAARKASDAADFLTRLTPLARANLVFAEWLSPQEWALRKLMAAERTASASLAAEEQEDATAGLAYHPWVVGLTPAPGDFSVLEAPGPLFGLAAYEEAPNR